MPMQQILLGLGGKKEYTISVSSTNVNEGSTVTTTVTTKGVADGTTLYAKTYVDITQEIINKLN